MILVRSQDTILTENQFAFLYTDNEQVETKIKNGIPFIIASPKQNT